MMQSNNLSVFAAAAAKVAIGRPPGSRRFEARGKYSGADIRKMNATNGVGRPSPNKIPGEWRGWNCRRG